MLHSNTHKPFYAGNEVFFDVVFLKIINITERKVGS